MRKCKCGREIKITGSTCDECWALAQLQWPIDWSRDVPEFDGRSEKLAEMELVAA